MTELLFLKATDFAVHFLFPLTIVQLTETVLFCPNYS